MSPSPQSQSQSPSYNFNLGMTTNFNIAAGGTQHMLSQNPQGFNMQRVSFNNTPSPMHISDFDVFGQVQALGQEQQQQQPIPEQFNNPYHGNNFNATWQESLDVVPQNPTMNLMIIGANGTNSPRQVPEHQQQPQQQADDMAQHWNVTAMHAQQQQHLHQHQLQQQLQQQQQQQVNLNFTHQGNNNLVSMDVTTTTTMTTADGITTTVNTPAAQNINTMNTNDNGPSISNLLSLDSEQLIRINSDELQQISCLSIST